MKSKKGFILTGIILAAITVGSFTVWLVPQNTQTKFVVSNPQEDLDSLIEQQNTIASSVAEEFDKMLAGEITPDNYIGIAEISTSQVNGMIIRIIDGDVPQNWQDSYAEFIGHLRAYNTYLRETMVVANTIKENPQADISGETERLEGLLSEAEEYLELSNNARPT